MLRVLASLVILALTGCGRDELPWCSEPVVEVRPFVGPAVTENRLDCAGDLAGQCQPAFVAHAGQECGEASVSVAQSFGHGLGVWISVDGDRAAARADYSIDLPEYDRDPIVAWGGWVSLEEWTRDARKGRFGLDFADGTVSGSFDTTAPPPL